MHSCAYIESRHYNTNLLKQNLSILLYTKFLSARFVFVLIKCKETGYFILEMAHQADEMSD